MIHPLAADMIFPISKIILSIIRTILQLVVHVSKLCKCDVMPSFKSYDTFCYIIPLTKSISALNRCLIAMGDRSNTVFLVRCQVNKFDRQHLLEQNLWHVEPLDSLHFYILEWSKKKNVYIS